MDNKEQWIVWSPDDKWNKKYYKMSLSLANDTFKIHAIDALDKTEQIQINFEESVLIFRVRKIKYCSEELQKIDALFGEDFHNERSFFKVINSSYVRWLNKESLERIDLDSNHYAFVFSDSIVDVVEFDEPEITQVGWRVP